MSTNEEQTTTGGMRTPIFVGGALLWTLAGIGFFLMWNKSRNQDPSIEKPGAAVSGNVTGDKPNSKNEPIILTPTRRKVEPKGSWDAAGIEDFEMTDQTGRKVTKADLLGKPWVVSFIFTRCSGTCPKISGAMWTLQDSLKEVDMRFVSITVDPEFDTLDRLKRYADAYEVSPERWLFLRGDKNKTYHMIMNSFKMRVMEMLGKDRLPGYEVLHSNNIMHVDAQGVVVGKYDGTSDTAMVKLRNALKNAAGTDESRHGNAAKADATK